MDNEFSSGQCTSCVFLTRSQLTKQGEYGNECNWFQNPGSQHNTTI